MTHNLPDLNALKLDQVEIGYRKIGEGKSVVLIHGAGSNGKFWRNQIGELDSELVIITLPGREGLDLGKLDIYIQDYADFVHEVVEELGVEDPIVIGHSMGGGIAQSYGLEYKTAGLGLISTGAILYVTDRLLEKTDDFLEKSISFVKKYAFRPKAGKEILDFGEEMMRDAGADTIHMDYFACDKFDVRDKISQIEAPSLVVYSEMDKLTPPKVTQPLAEKLPNSEIKEVKNSGHMIPLEYPKKTNDILKSWIEKLK